MITDFLQRAPDLINLTSNSFTPLACATNNNDLNVVKLLLDNGADVNLGIPEMKRTPLHIAIFKGYVEENGMADLLIAHKANLRARDTLYMYFIHFNHNSQWSLSGSSRIFPLNIIFKFVA